VNITIKADCEFGNTISFVPVRSVSRAFRLDGRRTSTSLACIIHAEETVHLVRGVGVRVNLTSSRDKQVDRVVD
jgi:hypothetical protein